jgi:nucleotide-binding universal stress UspA family protein
MYRKIAVAMDGSETASLALAEALRLAKPEGATLLLLHVCEELPLMWEPDGSTAVVTKDVLDALNRTAADMLEARRREAAASGLPVETRLVTDFSGHVGTAISHEAKTWGAELLVIGTHGRRGLDRLLLGSVAEGVTRTAAIPVLLIRAKS